MKQEDFTFTVGYNGLEAIVNKETEQAAITLSVTELVDQGYFKPALSKAILKNDKDGIQYLMDVYNQKSGSQYNTEIQIMRLFGVYSVSEEISKVRRL